MKPVDFRNATFADLRDRLAGQRALALATWRTHGPGTTQEVAGRAGISVLSFRPRSTELFQLGYICLTETQPAKGEGVYRARTAEEHAAWFAGEQSAARDPQRHLPLGV
jgi:hypothetical protein